MIEMRWLSVLLGAVACSCFGPLYVVEDGASAARRARGPLRAGRELVVEGDYVHHPTGLVFPQTIAGCLRGEVVAYDDRADDVGVSYDSASFFARVMATIYVYPRRGRAYAPGLKEHFVGVVEAILHRHEGARVVQRSEIDVASKRACGHGLVARLAYDMRIDFGNRPVISLAYLFACGDWFLLYRITFPAVHERRVQPRIRALLDSFSLPLESVPG